MDIVTKIARQTTEFGEKIAASLRGGEVLCLYGELGAGKTTFSAGIINFFLPGKRVISPTFIIVRHYRVNHPLIKVINHIDLYRIHTLSDIQHIGINELFTKDAITLMEWPQKMPDIMSGRRIDIYFEYTKDSSRKISLPSYEAVG